MSRAVDVSIFARCRIPVAMHGLDPPMPAVEAQDVVRIRLPRAGDGIRCFGFGFDTVPGPDVPALTPDAGNGASARAMGCTCVRRAHRRATERCHAGQSAHALFRTLSGAGPAIQ